MRVAVSTKTVRSQFVKRIGEISGQNILACYQCGLCSAGCPASGAMDVPPNQVMRLVQLGLEGEIAHSGTIWLCASCLKCSIRCPRGIDLARVMEALRLMILRKNIPHVDLSEIDREALLELPQVALVANFRKLTP
ncbi:MAG: heterodisulfide reductase [Chloroflexi bacterium RBG_13_54_9]|nr:MAG: heterodisulfide reductase [Chloroflexi bacterium RBG_13_54_9]